MLVEDVATELVLLIFFSCSSIADALALSGTCRRFRYIYASSQKLSILETVSEAEFGPLQDLAQLLTHNASQPPHLIRSVPFSIALLQQIVHAGRIAERWSDLYPFTKWESNYEHRRLLTTEERYRVRRAVYRLWLYTRAFHNSDHPRTFRATKLVMQRRTELLHNWSTRELAELADVHSMLRHVLVNDICPSDRTMSRRFKERYPESRDHALIFNDSPARTVPAHITFMSQSNPRNPFTSQDTASWPVQKHFHFHNPQTFGPRCALSKGWGEDFPHYYLVEDMMKLDPEQMMWLKENAPPRALAQDYVDGLGEWFEENGETWVETLEWVLEERGEDVQDFHLAILNGESGVAVHGIV